MRQTEPHLLPQENSSDTATRNAPRDLRRVMTHQDHWYPLAWSGEIKPGKMIGRSFAGDPVLLVRGKNGEVFALEDRCAHRQVPLHKGVVDTHEGGCAVKCGYHGWKYDQTGQCIDIPYFPQKRILNRVRAYPCHEQEGMIFIFPGDPSLADARLPGLAGSFSDKRYKTRRLDRQVDCHYSFMHENLMDMNHQFLHRRLMGGIKAYCTGRRNGDDWCEVDYTFDRVSGRQSMGEAIILGASHKVKAVQNKRTDLMTIRTEYPRQRLRFWVSEGDPVLDVWLAYTPLDKAQRTNRTFGYLSVKKPAIPGIIHVIWPAVKLFTDAIFKEDRHIVEMEQAAHDRQGTDDNNEIFPAINDLRDLLRRCGAPEEDGQV